MDYYKVLGIGRDASKEEIKAAFRREALDCHPDKHTHSPNSVRVSATHRFKLITEAYDVLRDDRKRAFYNINNSTTDTSYSSSYGGYNSKKGYGGYNDQYNSYNSSFSRSNSKGYGSHDIHYKLNSVFHFLSARVLLLNIAFACALVGGSVVFDVGREALWKMHNSGKSFEEAMESIENAKKRGEEV